MTTNHPPLTAEAVTASLYCFLGRRYDPISAEGPRKNTLEEAVEAWNERTTV